MSSGGGWDEQEPPAPSGWLTVAQAAEQLGVQPGYLRNRIAEGRVPSKRHGRRRWVAVATVEQIIGDRTAWISYAAAARILGCDISSVGRMVRDGRLARRRWQGRRASLLATEVAELAEERRRRAELVGKDKVAHVGEPPDVEHVWLDTATTALMLGVSPSRVRQYAAAERIPFTWHGRQRWFRRSDIEGMAAARAFTARRESSGKVV